MKDLVFKSFIWYFLKTLKTTVFFLNHYIFRFWKNKQCLQINTIKENEQLLYSKQKRTSLDIIEKFIVYLWLFEYVKELNYTVPL